MKEAEVIQLVREASLYVAKLVSIPHSELYDSGELNAIIKEKDFELHEKLENFIQAHWKYYFFVNSLTKGNLKKEELSLLERREKEKENLRRLLIAYLTNKYIRIS